MGWTAPTDRTTGDLITASFWNESLGASGNSQALRDGGLALASQAAGDVLYGSSATQLARLAIGTANKVLTSSGSAPQWSTQIANAALPTNIDVGGTLDVTGVTTLDSTLTVSGTGPHVIGGTTNDYTRLGLAGTFTSGGASDTLWGTHISGSLTGHSGDSAEIAGTKLNNTIVTAGSCTTIAQLWVKEPNITVGAGTVTNSATVLIESVSTAATNDYALWVDAGPTRLDGALTVGEDVAVATSVLFVDTSEIAIGVGTATPNYLGSAAAITLQGATQPRIEIVGTRTGDDTVGVLTFINQVSGPTNHQLGYISALRTGADNSGSLEFHTFNAGANVTAMTLSPAGALSKASGSFKIDHPLPSKTDTHYLVHSFIEGPRADLIYRGSATLVAGSATVDLDTAAEMTDGTWVLLCRDPQVFTSNESGWDAVRGSISGKTLTISCQDATSTDTVSWMVVAERQDQHMYDTDWTDDEGHVIVEPEKPEEPEP